MNIVVNPACFGIEFNTTTRREDVKILNDRMNHFFLEKSYSYLVDEIFIELFCLSPVKPYYYKLHYIEKQKIASPVPSVGCQIVQHRLVACVEIRESQKLIDSNVEEARLLMLDSIVDYFEKENTPKRIKDDFDKAAFIKDLKLFRQTLIGR